METLLIIIFFIISLMMLVWGGNLLVDSAIKFSKVTGLSQIMVGSTIVSLITALPELLITIFYSTNNVGEVAVGNTIGSMLFNFLIIIGLLLVSKPFTFNLKYIKSKIIIYATTLLLLFIFVLSGKIGYFEGAILFFAFVVFYVLNIRECKIKSYNYLPEKCENKKTVIFDMIFLLIIGGVLIGLGAKILVDNSIKLAGVIGVKNSIIGFTLVAVGTSVPELTTAFLSIKKGYPQISIGNIIGTNILNGTLLLSSSVLLNHGKIYISDKTIYIFIPILILSFLIFLLPLLKFKTTKRWQGAILFVFYMISVIVLFVK